MRLVRFLRQFFCLLVISAMAVAVYAQPSAMPVVVVTAKLDTFRDTAEALGTLRANESVALTVNVAETITAIHFEDGERVKQGDVLVELMSAEEGALLVEAETNVRESKRQLDRIQQLVKAGTASESLLDERQRDYDTARARLVATQSRLKDRIVKAPFSGVLGLRNVSVGSLVSPGDVITTLTDNSQMKLDFTVPSIFLSSLAPGLPVVATSRIYAGESFKGDVSSIDNQIDPVTRAIRVRAILPNPDQRLKQGMLMTVDVFMNAREAIVLPEAALLPQGKETFVMVVSDNDGALIAEKRQVTVASRRLGEVELSAGVAAGEKIVTHGGFKMKPGMPVRIISSATEKTEAR